VSSDWRAALDAEREDWRSGLAKLGFVDDGTRLRGPVTWTHPVIGSTTARVEIRLGDAFPFAPPAARVLDHGTELEPTFHLERPAYPGDPGGLCLWETDWPVDEAPWRDPVTTVDRIRGWLEQTAAGWLGDEACDLERYLEPDDRRRLVLYDWGSLGDLRRTVRTSADSVRHTVTITTDVRRPAAPSGRRGLRRRDRNLAWVGDVGQLDRPLRGWADLAAVLGPDAEQVARFANFGAVEFVLLGYRRGSQSSALALSIRPSKGGFIVRACESADTGSTTRMLRAGTASQELANASVAVVGVGAVGSFLADLLYRSGVRRLTLRDGEVLRPGNVVRHLAGDRYVGASKAEAVKECLAALGLDVGGVIIVAERLTTLTEALELVQGHDLVVDATANARASSLLASAANATGRTVISVCVQRAGDVLRVDRFPLRGHERHLAPLPAVEGDDLAHERGCGSAVSRTPPGAVFGAAELAARVVIDEARHNQSFPATVADVRGSQPEPPFDQLGLIRGASQTTDQSTR
jgi:hypothetical protein